MPSTRERRGVGDGGGRGAAWRGLEAPAVRVKGRARLQMQGTVVDYQAPC